MLKILCIMLLVITGAADSYAAQSVILESEGYACMGDDKSRKQTETSAFQDGRRKATESAATYIQSETRVKDAVLEKDLMSAYAHAQVRVLQEVLKEWYREASLGDCYRVKLKVEVIPDEKAMAGLAKRNREALEDDPAAPLSVRVWTDRAGYAESETVRIYLKGNKPFYGRVVYSQADGSTVQLLPNPYRKDYYFNGAAVYELPGSGDRFSLDVCPPFGLERITLYASTAPGGDPQVEAADAVYKVLTKPADMAVSTRGIRLSAGGRTDAGGVAEFAESSVEVTTGKEKPVAREGR